MSIQFKKNFDLKQKAREIRENVRVSLEKAMLDASAEIKARTKEGVGAEGETFDSYTPEYAAYKFKKRKRGGFAFKSKKAAFEAGAVQSTKYTNFGKVDLLLTGRMLEAIRVKVKRESSGWLARLYFSSTNAAVKARGHMEGYKNKNPKKIRNFFALSASQMEEILYKLRRAINGR